MTSTANRPARVLLASQSPRRLALLQQIALPCDVVHVDVNEARAPGEAPADYVQRLAIEKARAGRGSDGAHNLPVIGADTCVCLDNDVLGKPLDAKDAIATLRRLSGRDHQVMTAVALAAPAADAAIAVRLCISDVSFRELTDDEIGAYCATEEPMDKAGAYAIQGRGGIEENAHAWWSL